MFLPFYPRSIRKEKLQGGSEEERVPITGGIGHSVTTPIKQQTFEGFLDLHLALWTEVVKRHQYFDRRYYYLDLTAGSGKNPQDDSSGSPLIFLDAVSERGTPFDAVLMESDRRNFYRLCEAIESYQAPYQRVDILHQDHVDLPNCPWYWPRKNQVGLAYYDPNSFGVSGGESASFNSVVELFKQDQFKRIDFLASVFATNIKRIKHVTGKCMVDWLRMIGKQVWLVRKPLVSDAKKWTMLLGTNWADFPKYTKIGFCKTGSPEGRKILTELNYSKEERKALGQQELFQLSRISSTSEIQDSEVGGDEERQLHLPKVQAS